MVPIVLLCGTAGSGKDTVAGMLRDQVGARSLALADPIKRFVGRVLGMPDEVLWGPSAARETLVHLDADAARAQIDALWAVRWVYDLDGTAFNHDGLARWLDDQVAFAREHGGCVTPRYALQTLGTEWGRKTIGPDVWVRLGVKTARAMLGGTVYDRVRGLPGNGWSSLPPFVCITDGRFANEVLAVKEAGGLAVLIQDPDAPPTTDEHESERGLMGIPCEWFDTILMNDKTGGLGALRREVADLRMRLFRGRATP